MEKFGRQGEKTSWTYLRVVAAIAGALKPGKKGFRVKGTLDEHPIQQVALVPMGGGDFILPVNGAMRKAIRKTTGATVHVRLELDNDELKPPAELLDCLQDEPVALSFYNKLTVGQRNYFTKWIESAKTDVTKANRIALAVNALAKQWDFGKMLRENKKSTKYEVRGKK